MAGDGSRRSRGFVSCILRPRGDRKLIAVPIPERREARIDGGLRNVSQPGAQVRDHLRGISDETSGRERGVAREWLVIESRRCVKGRLTPD